MSRGLFLVCTAVCVASIAGCKGRKAAGPPAQPAAEGPAVEATTTGDPKPPATTSAISPPDFGLTNLPRGTSGEIPVVAAPAEPPPEVKRCVETLAALRLATQSVERLTPPPPKSLPDLDLGRLNVGDRGRINVICEILQVEEGMLLVSPVKQGDAAIGKSFAVSGLDTATRATGQEVGLDGDYEAYRTAKFGTITAVVVRKYAPPEARDPQRDAMLELALTQKRQAEAAHEESRARLKEAREAAVARAVAAAKEEARRRYPVPKDGPVQDRIRAQRNYDEALNRFVKAAKESTEARYAEPK
jgi:hypothetical protein